MSKIDVELLAKAGLDEETIAKIVKDAEKKAYNEAIEGFLDLPEVKAVVKIVTDAPFPIRLVVEKATGTAKATSKVQKPSGSGSGSTNGRNGKKVKLLSTGEVYDTFAAACEACDLPLNGRSGKIVLEGAGEEFELVDVE